MLPEYFGVIGALIASAGGIYYLIETIRGKTKPNKITWLLWGLLPLIIFVAQRVQGVEAISWVSFVSGFFPLLVFVAAYLNKKSYWKLTSFDYVCVVISLIGVTAWSFADSPNTAILFITIADFAAGLPTFIKAYKHPETESWKAFAVSAFGFFISVLSIQVWNFENAAFAVYLLIANSTIALFASNVLRQSKGKV